MDQTVILRPGNLAPSRRASFLISRLLIEQCCGSRPMVPYDILVAQREALIRIIGDRRIERGMSDRDRGGDYLTDVLVGAIPQLGAEG